MRSYNPRSHACACQGRHRAGAPDAAHSACLPFGHAARVGASAWWSVAAKHACGRGAGGDVRVLDACNVCLGRRGRVVARQT